MAVVTGGDRDGNPTGSLEKFNCLILTGQLPPTSLSSPNRRIPILSVDLDTSQL